MSEATALFFKFDHLPEGKAALETLHELGYTAHLFSSEGNSGVVAQIGIAGQDLVSALEIAQLFGGALLETDAMASGEEQQARFAYEPGGISLPAHKVVDLHPGDEPGARKYTSEDVEPGEEWFDPEDDHAYYVPEIKI